MSTFDALPLWHCSIALVDSSGALLALYLWNDNAFVKCQRLFKHELLAGIGDPALEPVEIVECALHLCRCCSDPETEELNSGALGLSLRTTQAGTEQRHYVSAES